MPGQKAKPLEDILVSVEAEKKRYTLQQRRARQLVEQAQRALRDSKRLHQWHVGWSKRTSPVAEADGPAKGRTAPRLNPESL